MEKYVDSKDLLIKLSPENKAIKRKVDSSKLINVLICLMIIVFFILLVIVAFVIKNAIQIKELNEQIYSYESTRVVNIAQKCGNALKIEKNLKQERIEWNVTPNPGRLNRRSVVMKSDDEESNEKSHDLSEPPLSNETTTQPTSEQKSPFEVTTKKTRRKHKGKNRRRGDKEKKSKKKRKQKVAVHLHSNMDQNTWALAMKMKEDDKHYLQHGYIQDQAYSPFNMTYSFWALDDWCKDNTLVKLSKDTTLTVRESGTYYVYVQIMHRDDKRMWAAAIFIDGERFIQCVGSKSSPTDSGAISDQCNVGGTTYIEKGQKLHVGSLYRSPELVLIHSATFWGLIKLD